MNATGRKFIRIFAIPLIFNLSGIFLLSGPVQASSLTDLNIIALTNRERTRENARSLAANELLAQAAANKAKAILAKQTFAHNLDGRKFSDWIKEAGYDYSYVGENLAMDFRTAEGAIKAWLDSPTHRKNILNPEFAEIGVAVMDGIFSGQETTVVVQIFGVKNNGISVSAARPKTLSNRTDALPRSSGKITDNDTGFFGLIPDNISGYKYQVDNDINSLSHAAACHEAVLPVLENMDLRQVMNQFFIRPLFSSIKSKVQLSRRG